MPSIKYHNAIDRNLLSIFDHKEPSNCTRILRVTYLFWTPIRFVRAHTVSLTMKYRKQIGFLRTSIHPNDPAAFDYFPQCQYYNYLFLHQTINKNISVWHV